MQDRVAQAILLCLQPVDQLLDERVDAGAAGVEAQVRVLVRRRAGAWYRRSSSARSAASGRRPSAGIRAITRSSGASSQTDTPSWLMAARFGGSTNVPPPVATTTWRVGQLVGEHGPFGGAEVRLAVPREDLGDRQALALLDQLVDVHGLPVEAPRQRAADARLAGRHETDQIHLVGLHATSRPSVSKKPG